MIFYVFSIFLIVFKIRHFKKFKHEMETYSQRDLKQNQLQLFCNKNAYIYEYQFFPETTCLDWQIQALVEHFRKNDNTCLFEGRDTIYLYKKLITKVSRVTITNLYAHPTNLTIKFRRQLKLKFANKFLQTLLFNKVIDLLNDNGDPCEISDLNVSRLYNLSLTHGFWQGSVKSITDMSNGVIVTYDVSHQITCQLTLYEFMRRKILQHQNDRACFDIVRDSFIGKKVMTRYNNRVYRIDEIDFTSSPLSSFLDDDGTLVSFAKYYELKYGIQIRHLKQPILINRVEVPSSSSITGVTTYIHCLLPELCYPVYDEWNPLGANAYDEFKECLTCTPMVKRILADWGLSLKPKISHAPKPILLCEVPETETPRVNAKKKSPWNLLSIFSK